MKRSERIAARLFHNIGLKLGALCIAALLWLLVTAYSDPVSSIQFSNIPVRLTNTSLITDAGNVYTVLDGSDTIPTVTVMANRSIVDALNADNIVATANVADLNEENMIEIHLSSNKYNNEISSISGSIVNVRLSIEKKRTATYSLRTSTSGQQADGYYLGDVTPEQNQIRITGPESVVTQVASAVANVDVSGATASISTYADVQLYDAGGQEVSKSGLTLNIASVRVSATILPIKEVPLAVAVSGTPADGYVLNGTILSSPNTVDVAGRSAVLSSLDYITVPQGVMDVTGLTEDLVKTVNIKDYLPENVVLSDSEFDGTVQITVGVEESQTRTAEFEYEEILLENLPDDYEVELLSASDLLGMVTEDTENQTLSLYVRGPQAELDAVTSSGLQPAVDVEELLESLTEEDRTALSENASEDEESPAVIVSGPVQVTLPAHVTAQNTVTVRLAVRAKAEGNE